MKPVPRAVDCCSKTKSGSRGAANKAYFLSPRRGSKKLSRRERHHLGCLCPFCLPSPAHLPLLFLIHTLCSEMQSLQGFLPGPLPRAIDWIRQSRSTADLRRQGERSGYFPLPPPCCSTSQGPIHGSHHLLSPYPPAFEAVTASCCCDLDTCAPVCSLMLPTYLHDLSLKIF